MVMKSKQRTSAPRIPPGCGPSLAIVSGPLAHSPSHYTPRRDDFRPLFLLPRSCYLLGVSEQEQTSEALEALRREIDALDAQIVELLSRRAGVSRRVGELKQGDGRAVYTPAREAEILDRLTRLVTGALRPDHLRAIYREILSASRDLQRPPRIAFLGPKATYGHQAALQRFGSAAKYIPAATNPGIVDEVERGVADFGVLPIENSTAGPVGESQDRLVETELKVCDEVTILVAHCLLARCPIEGVETIYAHPQAADQCSRWVAQNLPGRHVVHVASNGLAAERAAQEGGVAAIAPRVASQVFGLDILAADIQDVSRNYTRFWVVGRRMSERPSGSDKTAVVFSIRDRVGALREVIQIFADAQISLSAIQSRPSRRKAWDYVFFIELRGHAVEPHVQDALRAAEQHTVFLKVLGAWPVAPASEEP
jgi:chorismate mutase / prephenate dehydratase